MIAIVGRQTKKNSCPCISRTIFSYQGIEVAKYIASYRSFILHAGYVGKNWKKLFTSACLWAAFLTCNMAYSAIAPFFAEEVILYI